MTGKLTETRTRGDELAAALLFSALDRIHAFARTEQFNHAVASSFGDDVDADHVRAVLATFDEGAAPVLAVVSGDALNGAKAAYSAETNTVYVSADFLAGHDRADILAVLVEELGHAVDAKVHAGGDATGDEGAIFSALVMGETISPTDLSALRLENDHGAIVVDGKAVAVEYATYGTINVDGTINASEWTAAERLDTVGGGTANYAIYGKYVAGTFVFAVQSGVAINANTTFWLNTDQNNATGYKVWGFAAGAEYNVNTSGTGVAVTANLYGKDLGAGLGTATAIDFKFNATRTMMEFAVPASALGNTTALNLYADINDSVFIPNSYDSFTYSVSAPVVVPPTVIGDITLDGVLTDWAPTTRIDTTLGTAGYEVYGKVAGDAYIIALKAPVAIGPNTTAWLNTDQNAATGYQIWGFSGGAEFNVNFTGASKPQLYSDADGATLVSANLPYFFSADKTIVEFAIPKSMIGSPSAINTMFDINNTTFLSSNYAQAQYAIGTPTVIAPVVGSTTLDGALNDWTALQRIDYALGVPGYEVYGKIDGGSFIIAIRAPTGTAIGANTTAWLNTDLNTATGFQVFGNTVGAEYNITFDATGAPKLYTGADGEVLVDGAEVKYGYNADKSVLEFAIAKTSLGAIAPTATGVSIDVNNSVFLPNGFSAAQYTIAPPPATGSITIDGALGDWNATTDRIDKIGGTAGYEVYGKVSGNSWVIAIKSNVAIGPGTTAWLNTDQDPSTGFQVFGNSVGAEFNVDFDATGKPMLYSGSPGQTLVNGNLAFAYSADKKIVEFAISKGAINSAFELNTTFDINNNVSGAPSLPSNFSTLPQYEIVDAAALAALLPARSDVSKKVGIVYSETTAKIYFGLPDENVNKTAYSQLFMTAQSQAMAAGVPFDILTEADLKDISKLKDFDTIVFPSFRSVNKADYVAIHNTLELAVDQYKVGLIAAGDFMTNDETGAVLPGDPYARMKEFFDLTRVNGGTGVVDLKASDVSHPVMQGYAAGEVIRHYDGAPPAVGESGSGTSPLPPPPPGVGWQTFADVTPGVGAVHSVLDIQTVNGTNYDAVIATTTGGRNVHFATESFLGDNNQLQNAIEWSVGGAGVHVGLQITRNTGVFAGRNDMDQAQELDDVRPLGEDDLPLPTGGIYTKLLPILEQWKAAYNFVSSYYIDIGAYTAAAQLTDWSASKPYFDAITALGNEIGSHSYTHPQFTDLLLPEIVTDPMLQDRIAQYHTLLNGAASACACPYCMRDGANQAVVETLKNLNASQFNQILQEAKAAANPSTLDPVHLAVLEATFYFQFGQSKAVIDQQLGINIAGAAVPGMPEKLPTSIAILQYYNYLSGGYSAVGAGYPGAFGYLTPEIQDKVYLAPNMSFDFTLVEFQRHTPAEAQAIWTQEFQKLMSHGDASVVVWPWHDYGPTAWVTPGDVGTSPYNLTMFTNFLAAAHAAGVEFVRLDDLAKRIQAFEASKISYSISGNVVTATVTSTDAGKFAIDLDDIGTQKIVSINGWYAYDADSVFLPRNGGAYAITLGAAPADVTHIIELPMRSELVSITGNGRNLSFTVVGEGKVVVDLQNLAGGTMTVTRDGVAATYTLAGELMTLDLGVNGSHDVSITMTAPLVVPVITSNGGGVAAAINFTENGAGAVTTVTATDTSGAPVTYSIAGGADAGKFAINASTGALTFLAPPDFEVPTDAGPNNVYDVIVRVTNTFARFDEQAIAVTVTNVVGTTYNGTTGNDTFNGTAEDDTANGNNGNDTLNGLAGNDTLNGNAGTDTLNGGDGNDVLNGGAARDVMTGGAGTDRFVFSTAADAGNTAAARDVINDFTPGTDKIDLALVDSNSTVADVQTFILLPAAGQTFTAPGQLRYYYETIGGVEHTIVEGNTTGTTGSEFMIDLVGRHTLTGTDFIGVQVISGPQAPVISSNGGGDTGGASAPENGTAAATVTATDLNGDAVTYSITGGADADRFTINATTGALAFLTAPDFEIPGDVGANNVYDVIVQASDGTLVDTQALAVTVTNVAGPTQNGTTAANTMNGTGENETINGAGGNDTISGLGGNDILNGDAGADTVNGGDGNDTITGGAGIDILNGDAGNDTISGGDAVDTLRGGEGDDTLNGDAGADNLFGDAGNDILNGGAANDVMNGGDGNDTMNGGAGNDSMTGGADADTFVFAAAVAEIGNGTTAGTRDTIQDFQVGVDRIDFSAIDAATATAGNQAFTLLATQGAAFTAPGQLRYVYQTISGVVHTIIEGNVTGNSGAEFRLDLVGQHTLTSADFIL